MMVLRGGLLLAATMYLLVISASVSEGRGTENTVPGVLLVRFAEGEGPVFPANARGKSYNETLGVWRVRVPPDDAEATLAALADDPAVETVSPQYVYRAAAEPDDPLYRSKQHVHYRVINLQAAWAGGVPPNEVTVAVLDGGVDIAHPELAGRTWVNGAEVVNGLDDDANGCVDDVSGCSFQSPAPDGDIADRDGHGTFVAGIIAAAAGNGQGIAGIAQNAIVMPVRTLDPDGAGTTEQLAESILYAARNGADELNLSLVLPPIAGTCPTDPVVEAALQEAVTTWGAVVVAAGGNFGINCVGYPASSVYSIAVGGSGPAESSDSHAPFAQWGPQIDVAAPAMGLVSACPVPTPEPTPYCPGGVYGEGDGTSFSTPIAAGVTALLLGSEPALTPAEVEQRLKDTARDVPDENRPNWDGAGIIDAGAALGSGTVFGSLDLRGDDLSTADARVLVGDPASPNCESPVWSEPDFTVDDVASALGAGECEDSWPPTEARPWRLGVSSNGDKGHVINSWSLTSGGLSCSAEGLPLIAPVGAEAYAVIDCGNGGIVSNDTPEGATMAGPGMPRRFQRDVRYASTEAEPATACAPSVTRSTWYRVTGTGGGLSADTIGAEFETVLSVFRDDGGALTEVACNDDAALGGSTSRVVWDTEAGADYRVRAAAYQSTRADVLLINFAKADIPPNDDESIPRSLAVSEPAVQAAHSASSDVSDPAPACAGGWGSTLWFTVTGEADGALTVATTGSTYDTVVQVMSGDVVAACNDEEGGGPHTSRATWAATAGSVYAIVVGSYLDRPAGVLRVEVSSGP
jgi:subtilisin family serine protease